MKQFFLILILLSAGLAYGDSQNAVKTPAEVVADEVLDHKTALAEIIREKMEASLGVSGSLKNFRVDWDTLRCVEAEQSAFEPVVVGACTVAAGAFQVGGQFSITLAQTEFIVATIYADVE